MKRTLQLVLALLLGHGMALQADMGLITAAREGDLVAVHQKLTEGEKVNDVDSNGWTALMWAIYYRRVPVVELLLGNGADPNIQSTDSKKSYAKGATALIIAANDCQEDFVRRLLKQSARKELADSKGGTAESYARKVECPAVLKLLDIEAAGTAAMNKLIKEIEDGRDVNAADEKGWTPIMWAVYSQDLPSTELLLQKGANPNAQAEGNFKDYTKGTTPLIIACAHGSDDLARLLLKRNANPELKDATGRTAADWARANRNNTTLGILGVALDPKVGEMLKDIRAGKRDVNAIGEFGWSPLMFATHSNDLASVNVLLDLGANPNIQSVDTAKLKIGNQALLKGTTAPIIACLLNQEDMIKAFKQKGANFEFTDESEKSVIDYAIKNNFWNIQTIALNKTPVPKKYNKILIDAFEGYGGIKDKQVKRIQEVVSKLLLEWNVFENTDIKPGVSTPDDLTVRVQVEISEFEIPILFGNPSVHFVVRYTDAISGKKVREQKYSLTTGFWSIENESKEVKFVNGIGRIIAEQICMSSGKISLIENKYIQEASTASPVQFFFDSEGFHIYYMTSPNWQWIYQVRPYPRCREKEFKLSSLKYNKIAVVPISYPEIEESVKKIIMENYFSEAEFLKSLSRKVSARCLSVAGKESIGTDGVQGILDEDGLKALSYLQWTLSWADSMLLAIDQPDARIEPLSKQLRAKGIRYLLMPHHLQMASVAWGNGGPNRGVACKVVTSLGLAVCDLAKDRIVWNGPITASTKAFGGLTTWGDANFPDRDPKLFEDTILVKLEAGILGDK